MSLADKIIELLDTIDTTFTARDITRLLGPGINGARVSNELYRMTTERLTVISYSGRVNTYMKTCDVTPQMVLNLRKQKRKTVQTQDLPKGVLQITRHLCQ